MYDYWSTCGTSRTLLWGWCRRYMAWTNYELVILQYEHSLERCLCSTAQANSLAAIHGRVFLRTFRTTYAHSGKTKVKTPYSKNAIWRYILCSLLHLMCIGWLFPKPLPVKVTHDTSQTRVNYVEHNAGVRKVRHMVYCVAKIINDPLALLNCD